MRVRLMKVCDQFLPRDPESARWWAELESGQEVELEVCDVKRRRSHAQNRAMWAWCEMLASALNDAGYDMRLFPYREGIDVPWTKQAIMDTFWRPVQQALTEKASTRDQTTVEVSEVYEAVNRAMAMRTGVSIPFPQEGF